VGLAALARSKKRKRGENMNVFIIAAMTLDGFIAQDVTQVSTSWTSQEDKNFFRERTKQAGVIIVGAKTYQTIGRPLPGRQNIVYSKNPTPTIPPAANLQVTSAAPADLIAELAAKGYKEVAICGGASIYSLFLQSGLVNKLYITLEPVVFGSGVQLFGEGRTAAKLHLVKVEHLSAQTLLLEYDVQSLTSSPRS
jgi:dihydrofolate reductase